MKFWPIYKKYTHNKGAKTVWLLSRRLIYLPLILIMAVGMSLYSKNLEIYAKDENNLFYDSPKSKIVHKDKNEDKKRSKPKTTKKKKTDSSFKTVVSTIFWVGEIGSSDNGFISNVSSAWINNWQKSFGGVDDPYNRNGYLPAGFKPKENPFYFALPYSDITDSGKRKDSAKLCPGSQTTSYSWCKNSWIEIKSHGRTVYAQWEDVGPYESNDYNYVFGQALPKNKIGAKAGLDVSPAVRDYLKLEDVDKCSWRFVSASKVPAGPWKNIVTTSTGYRINP